MEPKQSDVINGIDTTVRANNIIVGSGGVLRRKRRRYTFELDMVNSDAPSLKNRKINTSEMEHLSECCHQTSNGSSGFDWNKRARRSSHETNMLRSECMIASTESFLQLNPIDTDTTHRSTDTDTLQDRFSMDTKPDEFFEVTSGELQEKVEHSLLFGIYLCDKCGAQVNSLDAYTVSKYM